MNVYLELTKQFNTGRLRAIISSGQAVVLHRLAIMSKDGDWLLREDAETMEHLLRVLSKRGARYRFCAPLDLQWLQGGWSSHFEFRHESLRVRTDLVTRPPRLSRSQLDSLWREQEGRDPPFVDVKTLAELKKTNREKDYAVIGELARLMTDPRDQLLFSRSARDLAAIAALNADLLPGLLPQRSLLAKVSEGRGRLEEALDAERRALIHANEERLRTYQKAAEPWKEAWPDVEKEIAGHSLLKAHEVIVRRAEGLLPACPLGTGAPNAGS